LARAGYCYPGDELDVFAHAGNWKTYLAGILGPFIAGEVLEVGAGIGATARLLHSPAVRRWVCLEPDLALAERIAAEVGCVEVRVGTIAALGSPGDRFDTILYVDVLEHIEQDAEELRGAAGLLRPGGRMIVVAPAHGFLFSPFDRAIGHFRRYDRAGLRRIAPPGLSEELVIYVDSAGMLLSMLNRALLRSSRPTLRQIMLWDRSVVPISRRLDPVLGYAVGKSVIAVWRAAGPPS
jgi:SAM-dependent methyltransferase